MEPAITFLAGVFLAFIIIAIIATVLLYRFVLSWWNR